MREPISKRLRFEVFKRDKFTCQYCGATAPDAVLEIDHIQPVSKDGTNDILNLVAACRACNSGKSNKELSDSAVVDKQREQLEELQDRREQIDMMFKWKKELLSLDAYTIMQVAEFWSTALDKTQFLTDTGKQKIGKLIKRYGLQTVLQAIITSTSHYLQYDENGNPTKESGNIAFNKIAGICRVKSSEKDKPYLHALFYIRGIIRNRFNYINEHLCLHLLEKAHLLGCSIEGMKEVALDCKNWTEWREAIEEAIEVRELM